MAEAGSMATGEEMGSDVLSLEKAITQSDTKTVQRLLVSGAVLGYDDWKHLLNLAVEIGRLPIVQLMLRSGDFVDVDKTDAIRIACEHGHAHILPFLLVSPGRSTCHCNGPTPLRLAIQSGQTETVRYLLKDGMCDVNEIDKNRQTLLHLATSIGNFDIVKLLLRHGASVDRRDDVMSERGETCLHYTVRMARQDLCELLLDYDADCLAMNSAGKTPLYVAAASGQLRMIALMLESPRSRAVDFQTTYFSFDSIKTSPLLISIVNNDIDILALLLRTMPPKEIREPLQVAATGGATESLSLILESMPRVVAECHAQEVAPLVAHNGNVPSMKLLLNYGCWINFKYTNFERTLLHEAAQEGHAACVELLIDHGADINICDALQGSPLAYAIRSMNLETIECILAQKIDTNTRDFFGNTPLILATRTNMASVVHILLEKKSRVNARSRDGTIPLHIAAEAGLQDITTLLCQYGACPNFPNQKGMTSLHLAVAADQTNILIQLLNAGDGDTSRAPLLTTILISIRAATRMLRLNLLRLLILGARSGEPAVVLTRVALKALKGSPPPDCPFYRALKQPFSLFDLSRIAVRRSLGDAIWRKVEALPLPRTVKSSVLLEDFTEN